MLLAGTTLQEARRLGSLQFLDADMAIEESIRVDINAPIVNHEPYELVHSCNCHLQRMASVRVWWLGTNSHRVPS